MIGHDRLFKELLSTFFWEFLDLFLPDLARELDPASLKFLDKEVFTDVTSGDSHEVDLLVQARLHGSESLLVVHLEHQAQGRTWSPFRMFSYFARLHLKFGLPIVPVVLFSFRRPLQTQADKYQVQVLGETFLSFRFHVVQLNRLRWRDFVRRQNPVASALMARMQIPPGERPLVKLECLRSLRRLSLTRAQTRLLSGFVQAYLPLEGQEEQRFRQELARMGGEEKKKVMKIWMVGEKEGYLKGEKAGHAKGLKQGRAEGMQESIRQIVLARWPQAGADLLERLGQTRDTRRLERLLKKVVQVSSLEDLASLL